MTEFFGETNRFNGIVSNSFVQTPVGKIKAPNEFENKNVEVHVRPQGIKLKQQPTPVNGIKGTVMASKLMGSFSLVLFICQCSMIIMRSSMYTVICLPNLTLSNHQQ